MFADCYCFGSVLKFVIQSIDEYILRDLEQMEKESDIDDILNYRSAAERERQVYFFLECTFEITLCIVIQIYLDEFFVLMHLLTSWYHVSNSVRELASSYSKHVYELQFATLLHALYKQYSYGVFDLAAGTFVKLFIFEYVSELCQCFYREFTE